MPAICPPSTGPPTARQLTAIPQRPIRRTDLPGFVVNRGGEYCFIPSLSALRWLSELGHLSRTVP